MTTPTTNNKSKKASVFVSVRSRPLLPDEKGALAPGLVDSTTTAELVHVQKRVGPRGVPMVKNTPYSFEFPHVFNPQHNNQHVYDSIIVPMMKHVSNGNEAAMFAYGFTGSGKTHSVYGTTTELGLVFLAAQELMAQAQALGSSAYVRVAMFEVAGKNCYDLLNERAEVVPRSGSDGKVLVRGMSRHVVQTVEGLQNLISAGVESRQVGSSTVHDASSRSHAVVEFDVVSDDIMAGEKAVEEAYAVVDKVGYERDCFMISAATKDYDEATTAEEKAAAGAKVMEDPYLLEMEKKYEEASAAWSNKLLELKETIAASPPVMQARCAFIDMAGNDWEGATTVQTKEARREHAAINASLLAVKECIRALATGARRIPYRNSTLTHILQRNFESDSYVAMLATVSGSDDEDIMKQSLNTLRYAHLVGGVNKTARSMDLRNQSWAAQNPHKSTLAKKRDAENRKPAKN